MFVSLEGERIDKQRARDALGDKISVGLPPQVGLLLDPKVEGAQRLIFSPGPATETVDLDAAEWRKLLGVIDNRIVRY